MSKNLFPKNIIQSVLFTIILITTTFGVTAFFDFVIESQTDFTVLIQSLLSYAVPFLVLSFLAKKSVGDFSLSNTKYNIVFLLILISLTFAITIGIPTVYLISDFLGIKINQPLNNSLFFSLISIALLPAIFEELIITGVLFKNLTKNNSFIKSLIIATVLFSLIHLNIPKLPGLILGSIFTCYIYYKTQNILYPILIHLTINVASIFESFLVKYTSYSVSYRGIYGKNTVYILILSFSLLIIGLFYLQRYLKNNN